VCNLIESMRRVDHVNILDEHRLCEIDRIVRRVNMSIDIYYRWRRLTDNSMNG
jgi:hypothetical protein